LPFFEQVDGNAYLISVRILESDGFVDLDFLLKVNSSGIVTAE
jgi:hypothetical protein